MSKTVWGFYFMQLIFHRQLPRAKALQLIAFELRASLRFGQLIFHRQLPRAKALQLVAFDLRASLRFGQVIKTELPTNKAQLVWLAAAP